MNKIQFPHDQFFKNFFCNKEILKKFLKSKLKTPWSSQIDYDHFEFMSGSFSDPHLGSGACDCVVSTRLIRKDLPNQRLGLIIEHQSAVDSDMPIRLWRYKSVLMWKDFQGYYQKPEGPMIFKCLVIHHGLTSGAAMAKPLYEFYFHSDTAKESEGESPVLILLGNKPFKFHGKHDLFHLGEFAFRCATLGTMSLEDVDNVLKFFHKLLKKNVDLYGIVYGSAIESLLCYLMRYLPKGECHAKFVRGFQKLGMIKSEGESVMTTAERFFRAGEARGLVEGKVEGKSEGQAEGKVEERFEISKRMLELGISSDLILKCTGVLPSFK